MDKNGVVYRRKLLDRLGKILEKRFPHILDPWDVKGAGPLLELCLVEAEAAGHKAWDYSIKSPLIREYRSLLMDLSL